MRVKPYPNPRITPVAAGSPAAVVAAGAVAAVAADAAAAACAAAAVGGSMSVGLTEGMLVGVDLSREVNPVGSLLD